MSMSDPSDTQLKEVDEWWNSVQNKMDNTTRRGEAQLTNREAFELASKYNSNIETKFESPYDAELRHIKQNRADIQLDRMNDAEDLSAFQSYLKKGGDIRRYNISSRLKSYAGIDGTDWTTTAIRNKILNVNMDEFIDYSIKKSLANDPDEVFFTQRGDFLEKRKRLLGEIGKRRKWLSDIEQRGDF